MSGPGKVVFEQLQKKLKLLNVHLFSLDRKQLCGCEACKTISEMQVTLKLWMDIETIIRGD